MSPEIETFPLKEEHSGIDLVYGLTLLEGEPRVIGDGFLFSCFNCTVAILGLREARIKRDPLHKEEIDKEERVKAAKSLERSGMPEEMAEKVIDYVIRKVPGVIIRFKARPLLKEELPEGVRLGEYIGYDYELIESESVN